MDTGLRSTNSIANDKPANRWRDLMSAIAASRFNYYATLMTDFLCGFIFFGLGILSRPPSALKIAIATLCGIAFFTWMEYAIHRWLLHTTGLLTYLHAEHHDDPERIAAFLFPTSFVVLGAAWLLTTHLLHLQYAAFVIAGIGFGNSYYGLIHHMEHRIASRKLRLRWMQRLWAAHTVHHHFDDSNFGVITSFWDYVYGTHHTQLKRKRQRAAASSS